MTLAVSSFSTLFKEMDTVLTEMKCTLHSFISFFSIEKSHSLKIYLNMRLFEVNCTLSRDQILYSWLMDGVSVPDGIDG